MIICWKKPDNFILLSKNLRLEKRDSIWSRISLLVLACEGHSKRKWISFSTSSLHNLHILCSAGIFIYFPFSISSLCELIRNLVKMFLWLYVPQFRYGSKTNSSLNNLYVLSLLPHELCQLKNNLKVCIHFLLLSKSAPTFSMMDPTCFFSCKPR